MRFQAAHPGARSRAVFRPSGPALVLVLALLGCLLAAWPGEAKPRRKAAETVDGPDPAMVRAAEAALAATGQARQALVIETLAGLGDRSTGAPGCARAADFIEAYFKALSPDGAGRLGYLTPVMRHGPASLESPQKGRRAALRPAALNALTPGAAENGLDGPAVYVGRGDFGDMNGKPVSGSIVLMDLDSGRNWINAAQLGAKALVYVDKAQGDRPATRGLYQDKFELTPVVFPRFAIRDAEARALFGDYEQRPADLAGGPVRLTAEARWEQALSDNLYLLVPGRDPELSGQIVLVTAFYDSGAFTPGTAPGADQAASVAALLDFAASLRDAPPARTVLLAAVSGQEQSQAGMREFVAALRVKGRELRGQAREHEAAIERQKEVIGAVEAAMAAGGGQASLENPLLHEVLLTGVKDEADTLTTALMRLRLEKGRGGDEAAKALESRRQLLRRIMFRENFSGLSEAERDILAELLPLAEKRLSEAAREAESRLVCVMRGRDLRKLTGEKDIVAAVSLYLSSHGEGVGAFCDGFTFDLKPEVNMAQNFGRLGRFVAEAAGRSLAEAGLPPDYFIDALRPSPLRSWQSHLPDKPRLGGEISAIAGILGFTLATAGDGRLLWGTPDDTPGRVDLPALTRQSRFVTGVLSELASTPFDPGDKRPRNVFTTIIGRANFIRQGELFPERPAPGTVFCVFQGKTRFYAMADANGGFRVNGLSNKKFVLDKAVIEGFRFSPETGEAVWAVDKKQTGKEAYRLRMSRDLLETSLIMFGCDQSTLFSAFDPRTFRHFTKIELLDGRREAPPLRSWFSRMDTLDSTIVSLFLEPGTPFKLILSDTVLSRKLILLNATPERPDGVGYRVDEWPRLPLTELLAARDMWELITPRVKNLEDHGIVNDRLRELQSEGRSALEKATAALAALDYDTVVSAARVSWALATRVYNDVEKTQKDVLLGVLFYIALFVPFAYCLERVLFCFADIHKRIIGFSGILLATIAIVYQVHPAFKLTYSPLVVILAFFILGLSFMVALIIFLRFEREMTELQKRAMHIKTTEIGGFKAFAAAFVIGVSNLRRRRIRTTLTCLTLVILTFTIMSFTAVKSTRQEGAVKFGDTAPYKGVLLKNIGWRTIPPDALPVFRDMFRGRAVVSPLAWLELKDKTQPAMTDVRAGHRHETAQGVIGLSNEETDAESDWIQTILASGRWFEKGERDAVILPMDMADRLGVRPGDLVTIWGRPQTVVGIARHNGLDEFRDLDGETLTPVVFPSEAAVESSEAEKEAVESGEDVTTFQGRYQHLDGDSVIIAPFDALMGLGGELKSISVSNSPADPEQTSEAPLGAMAGRLADRFGLAIFAGEDKGSFVYHASETLGYAGVPNIVIPLIISVLIVLNTMIGAVFERKREIGVYTAVGLAPSHVSFLFIAESLAFAVLSVVLGYLLAQTAAGLLSGTALWAGMTANYSSLAGVAAMALVIVVVLLSVVYPSKVAGEIAIPDINRSWTLPEAVGDAIKTELPFLMRIREQECAGGFLFDYYNSHQDISHGLFSTDNVHYVFECPWEKPGQGPHPKDLNPAFCDLTACMKLTATVWLAPFDFGIKEQVTIYFIPAMDNPGFMEIDVVLHRLAGEAGMWKRLNKGFLNDLRKQLLVWRSLDAEARLAYEEMVVNAYAPGAPGGPRE